MKSDQPATPDCNWLCENIVPAVPDGVDVPAAIYASVSRTMNMAAVWFCLFAPIIWSFALSRGKSVTSVLHGAAYGAGGGLIAVLALNPFLPVAFVAPVIGANALVAGLGVRLWRMRKGAPPAC